jgi:hypothetical protein
MLASLGRGLPLCCHNQIVGPIAMAKGRSFGGNALQRTIFLVLDYDHSVPGRYLRIVGKGFLPITAYCSGCPSAPKTL